MNMLTSLLSTNYYHFYFAITQYFVIKHGVCLAILLHTIEEVLDAKLRTIAAKYVTAYAKKQTNLCRFYIVITRVNVSSLLTTIHVH